jgi:hypothetical protein
MTPTPAETEIDTVIALLEEIAAALAEMAAEDDLELAAPRVVRAWSVELGRAEYRATVSVRVHDLDPLVLCFELRPMMRIEARYDHLKDDGDRVICGAATRAAIEEPVLVAIDRAIQDLYERASHDAA